MATRDDYAALGPGTGLGGDARTPPTRLRFPTPDAAVACALGLRRRAGGVGDGFRAGLSADPASAEAIAARLCASSPAGEILTDRVPAASRYGHRPVDAERQGPARWAVSWWPGGHADHGVSLPGRARMACEQPRAFVGREREIATIEDAWRQTAAGCSVAALVAGDPGIGKTRLAAEAAAEVHRAGGIVLWGRCREDLQVPLQPFAEALGALPNDGALRDSRDDLVAWPIRRLLAGWSTDDPVAPTRRVLLDGATDTLETLSERAPTMLVLEDVHAIDASTLDLIRFLAGSQRRLRLLVLLTYRPLEAREREDVAAGLAELRREPGARGVEVAPLPEREILTLASHVLGREDAGALLAQRREELVSTAAGNPLFAIECARGLAGGHERAAQGALTSSRVGEAISARLDPSDADSTALLTAAAVCGREFEPELLGEVARVDSAELERSLSAAERAGVVARLPDSSRYEFTHSLVWQWLLARQPAAQCGRWHRRVADALERRTREHARPSAERCAELAWHWGRATPSDHERTIAWTASSASRALAAFDAERAELLYRRALELGESTGVGARHRVLIGLGMALRRLGKPGGRRTLLEAARLAREAGDVDALAHAALVNQSGAPSSAGAIDEESVAILRLAERELAARGRPGDAAKRARLLSAVSLELTFSGDDERLRLSDEAMRLARASRDPAAIASAALDGMHARWVPESLEERHRLAEEAVALASELGDPYLAIRAHHMRAVTRVQAGELALARADEERERALARKLGDSTVAWAAGITAAGIAIVEGDVALAEREAARALEAAEGSRPDAFVYHASQVMVIRFLQGRMAELVEVLEQAAASTPGIPGLRAPLALACLAAGRAGDAAGLLDAEAAAGFEALPRDTTWVLAHTIWAHVAADLGSAAAAEALARRLEPFADEVSYTAVSALGLVGHAIARLELALGRADEGIDRLRATSARYREMGADAWSALAETHLAAALEARAAVGDLPEAAACLRSAIALASGTGADGILGAARGATRGRAAPWVGAELAERARAAGLSRRELEVLMAASEGRTNSEIGEALGIAAGTVKRHLERIYDKVGVRTRTGAVSRIVGGHEVVPSGALTGAGGAGEDGAG